MTKITEYQKEINQHVKWGYEVVEVYSDDETDEVVKYKWKTYNREGSIFDNEDDAWSEAFEDCKLIANED